MMTSVLKRLRRSVVADGLGLALVLACSLFLGAWGISVLRGSDAVLRDGVPAIVQAPAARPAATLVARSASPSH